MNSSLKELKEHIRSYIDSYDDVRKHYHRRGNFLSTSKNIFYLQHFLYSLGVERGVTIRLDPSIISKSILQSFETGAPDDAYTNVDYQYNFLYHLLSEYKPDAGLVSLIDSFIKKYKKQFRFGDILVTSSGATRCKTNLRFALNDLRDLGLVRSKGANDKRNWSISFIGLLTLHNIEVKRPEVERWNCYKHRTSLVPDAEKLNQLPPYFQYDPVLIQSLSCFKDPTHIYLLLDNLQRTPIEDEAKVLVYNLINRYIDFTQEGLDITPAGIKITDKFKELSAQFQKDLQDFEDEHKELQGKLWKHLKKLIES